MSSTLFSIAAAVIILGASALPTNLFVQAMYIACLRCRTLNARRRNRCRRCGHGLRPSASESSSG